MSNRSKIALLVAGAIAIFFFDTFTNPSIVVSILYVVLIIIVTRAGVPRYIQISGACAVALTLLSYVISPGIHSFNKASSVDLGLSVFSIVATSYLGLKIVAAETLARQARTRAARALRRTSLAELAASIAHELNQPLAAAVANASAAKRWLERVPPDLDEANDAIVSAVRSAERAGEVVNGLRRLAAMAPSREEPFDVGALLLETVGLLQAEASEKKVYVDASISRDLPPLKGDRVLLQQAILNLLLNALEALDRVNTHTRRISVEAGVRQRNMSIVIRDNGPGIPPEAMPDLFTPFHTTKPGGLGIGLALTKSIAEAHGATLSASTCSPRGVAFVLEFPLRNGTGAPSGGERETRGVRRR